MSEDHIPSEQSFVTVRLYNYFDHNWYGETRRLDSRSEYRELDFPPLNHRWVELNEGTVKRNRLRNEADIPPGIGFLSRKKLGLYIPPSSYLSSVRWYNYTSRSNLGQFAPLTRVFRGAPFDAPDVYAFSISHPFSNVTSSYAEQKAIDNYYASARGLATINGGVAIAEMKETLGLVSSTIYCLVEVFRALKKGRFDLAVNAIAERGVKIPNEARFRVKNYSKRSKQTKADWASGAWLELQFGWKPLLSDIFSLAEATSEAFDGKYFPHVSISGYGETLDTESHSDKWILKSPPYNRYRSGITGLYTYTSEADSLLRAFGLTDPLSVAWEIVPFSFVIDWFLPIGNYIQNLSAFDNLELVHCTRWTEGIQSYNGSYYPYGVGNSPTAGDFSYGNVFYQRTERDVPPPPSLQFADLTESIGGWHVITSLALLQQFRK